jgi:hypothetical protein
VVQSADKLSTRPAVWASRGIGASFFNAKGRAAGELSLVAHPLGAPGSLAAIKWAHDDQGLLRVTTSIRPERCPRRDGGVRFIRERQASGDSRYAGRGRPLGLVRAALLRLAGCGLHFTSAPDFLGILPICAVAL